MIKINGRTYEGLFTSLSQDDEIKALIETQSQARDRNILKIKAFEKSEDPKLMALAEKITNCKKGKRCGCFACSICLRIYRKGYLKRNLAQLLRFNQLATPLYFATVISKVPFDVKCDDVKKHKKWLIERLKNFNYNTPLIGGVDFSFNHNKESSYICFHLHLIMATRNVEMLKEDLKNVYRRDAKTRIPVTFKRLKTEKDIKFALNYTIASYFEKHCKYNKSKKYPLSKKEITTIYSCFGEKKTKYLTVKNNLKKDFRNERI